MKRSKVQRLFAVACVTIAATGIPLVAATPAQAGKITCMQYLEDVGYKVGSKVHRACGYESLPSRGICVSLLQIAGVQTRHAAHACDLAQD